MTRYVFALAGAVALLGVGGRADAARPDCEPARCAVQAALESECPCNLGIPSGTATALNHGRYVSCVAHVVNALAKDGTIPRNCKGKIRRCAARSICGKEGAVTCMIPKLGTCDTTAGTCLDEAIAGMPCDGDADCVLETRCKIKRSADLCMARGGTVGESPTCCADCAATP
jgi:hypothetical protein